MSRLNPLARVTLARRIATILLTGVLCAQVSLAAQDPKIPADQGETKTTATGLKYCVLKAGNAAAPSPKPGDLCRAHYTGWHTDGRVFDSSHKRNAPFMVCVGMGVIKGWSEGLQLMKPGASYKFTVPASLAYGAEGKPPVIQKNETLIFQIDLLEVLPFESKQAGEKKLRSGLTYDVLKAGKGDAPGKESDFEIRWAFWNDKGEMLQHNYFQQRPMRGRHGKMPVKILDEGPCSMSPGAIYRFQVPAEFCFGEKDRGPQLPANSKTVWMIEMIRVIKPLPIPPYFESKPENLTKTASGLQYEVVKPGTGKNGQMNKAVTVHYVGWLPGGKIFDSSYQRGEPSTFTLGQVIEGWNEGLQIMKEGAIYKFIIPAKLAYGERGSRPNIGPNQDLEFLVELKKAH